MPNNTPTYWSADGESLHTYVHSIESIGPGLNIPKPRGEDVIIPGRKGSVWVPKDIDSRVLPLGMWVRGLEGTAAGVTKTNTQAFHTNWNNLVRLLFTPGRQFNLTKRFYDGDNTLRSATALAEYSSGLEPTMIGKNAAKTMVDLKLADPYFYDDNPQVFNLVNGDQTIKVRGNAPTTRIMINIVGARDNVIVRRKSPGLDHQVQMATALLAGQYMNINIDDYSAVAKKTAAEYDSTLDIRHSGHRVWLELAPGDNVINVSAASGTGAITMTVRGAWA